MFEDNEVRRNIRCAFVAVFSRLICKDDCQCNQAAAEQTQLKPNALDEPDAPGHFLGRAFGGEASARADMA